MTDLLSQVNSQSKVPFHKIFFLQKNTHTIIFKY